MTTPTVTGLSVTNTTITVPAQVWPGNTGVQPLIVNNDTTATLYIGNKREVLTKQVSSCVPISPLGSYISPDVELWAFTTAAAGANLLVFPGATQYDPGAVATQIALNAAGLATSANQTNQLTVAGATNTILGSPAQDATVAGVTTALGTPAQDDTLFNRQNLLLNGEFKNGSTANWSTTNATFITTKTAPVGGDRQWSAQVTPSGAATSLQLNGALFLATPNQEFQIRGIIYAAGLSAGQTVNLQVNWFLAGTFVSSSKVALTVLADNWYQVYGTVTAPASGIDHGNFIVSESGASGNIPVTDVLYVEDCSVHSQVAGLPAQDITVNGIPLAISVTGVPLLSSATSLLNFPATVIAASATNMPTAFTVGQIGYEFFISVLSNAASINPFLRVRLVWSDSVTGNTVASETWNLAGSNGTAQAYSGTGPTKGDTVSISFINQDTVNSVTVKASFACNSRVYVRDDWRQITSGSVPGFTSGTSDQMSNFLYSTSPSVPGSSTINRLMPLYAGLVNIVVFPAGAGTAQVTVSMLGSNTGLATPTVYSSPIIAANSVLNTQINLPRGPCEITLSNGAAGAQQITFCATIAEQPA
jgi:hypothetical protein